MESVPRTLEENFDNIYTWIRRLDRRLRRMNTSSTRTAPGGPLGPFSPTVDDFDTATASGFYFGSVGATMNVPSQDFDNWFLEVHRNESGQIIQTAQPHGLWNARYVRRSDQSGQFAEWVPMQLAAREVDLSFESGVAVGNGDGSLREWVSDGVLHQRIDFSLGSTSVVSSDIHVYVGWGNPTSPTVESGSPLVCGQGRAGVDGTQYDIQAMAMNNIVYLRFLGSSGPYSTVVSAGASVPAQWGAGDRIQASWSIPLT